MRSILEATALLALSAVPAAADVFLDTTGQGGTGNNVVFSGVDPNNSHQILGHLNGHNDQIVRFLDLSNTTGFSGAANGNDIKIIDTRDLDITVFDSTNQVELGTTRDIFSLKGSGDVLFRVSAVKADGTSETFNFTNGGAGYALGNGQSGFDFSVKNGEVITDVDLFLKGATGSITDFEHYRLDVAPIPTVAAVPEASTWAMLVLGFAGIGLMGMRRRQGGTIRIA